MLSKMAMKLSALSLLLCASSISASPLRRHAQATAELSPAGNWPDPEPCMGNCSYVHDPSVYLDGNTYYRFSTNGNIAMATAPSMQGPWSYSGPLLPSGSVMRATSPQELWAPDISKINGTFYIYYAASKIGSPDSDIGLVTAPSLAGPFTDRGSVGIPKSNRYNLIDPNLFIDSDIDSDNASSATQSLYLSFGSAWDAIFETRMTNLQSWSAGSVLQNTALNTTNLTDSNERSVTEGAFLFWWISNGTKYYYLFFSSGAALPQSLTTNAPGDEYKIMVCRSESPMGPFVDSIGRDCATQNGGSLVLGSHGRVFAPGGQGVMVDPASSAIVMYYHYIDLAFPSGDPFAYSNFQFGFNYLDFSSGWPVVTSAVN